MQLPFLLLLILLQNITEQITQNAISAAAEIGKQVKQWFKLWKPSKKELHSLLFRQELPLGIIQHCPDFLHSFWRQLSKLGVQFVRVPKLLLPSGKENSFYIALSLLFLGLDPAGPNTGQAGFIVGQQCGDPLQNLLVEMLLPIRLLGKGKKFAALCRFGFNGRCVLSQL